MLTSFLLGVLIAYMFDLIGMKDIFIDGTNKLFKKDFDDNCYYVIFGIIGVLTYLFNFLI